MHTTPFYFFVFFFSYLLLFLFIFCSFFVHFCSFLLIFVIFLQIRYGPFKGVVVVKPNTIRKGISPEELKCEVLEAILKFKDEYSLPDDVINGIHPEGKREAKRK